MADYTEIIQEINTNLPDNNTQSITAAKMRTTLIDMLEAVDNVQTEFEEEVAGLTKFQSEQSLNSVSIVNDLTTGGSNDVLSAEQGKVLNTKIGKNIIKLSNYTSTQLRGYVYGAYKNGDKIVIKTYGNAITSGKNIVVRYDDETTQITALENNEISKEITLIKDTSYILFILNTSYIMEEGDVFCEVISNLNKDIFDNESNNIVKFGYNGGELIEFQSGNIHQKKIRLYGYYKSGDKIKIKLSGTAVCNPSSISVRYDDETTQITALNNNTTSEITLSRNTTYIFFIINYNNIITDGSIYAEILSGLNRRVTNNEDSIENLETLNEFVNNHLKYSVKGSSIPVILNTGGVINSSGNIIANSNNNYYYSNKISVIPGETYVINANMWFNKAILAWYNGNTFIGGYFSPVDNSQEYLTDYTWVCPNGVDSLIICGYVTQPSINETTIISSPDKFLKWRGKKWAAVGDSLTEVNRRTTKHYFDYIADETGISIVNLGKSGTGYKKAYNTYLPFYQRIGDIPSDSDLITIFGSFNDLGAGSLGDVTDTTSETVCGCMNITFDYIQEHYPTIPFGVITPTPWTSPLTTSRYLNYVEKLITICKNRGIPVLDLYHSSNLHSTEDFKVLCYSKDGTYSNSEQGIPNAIEVTSDNISTINSFLATGSTEVSIGDWVLPNLNSVHPNELGHKIIAPRFKNFIESLLL